MISASRTPTPDEGRVAFLFLEDLGRALARRRPEASSAAPGLEMSTAPQSQAIPLLTCVRRSAARIGPTRGTMRMEDAAVVAMAAGPISGGLKRRSMSEGEHIGGPSRFPRATQKHLLAKGGTTHLLQCSQDRRCQSEVTHDSCNVIVKAHRNGERCPRSVRVLHVFLFNAGRHEGFRCARREPPARRHPLLGSRHAL